MRQWPIALNDKPAHRKEAVFTLSHSDVHPSNRLLYVDSSLLACLDWSSLDSLYQAKFSIQHDLAEARASMSSALGLMSACYGTAITESILDGGLSEAPNGQPLSFCGSPVAVYVHLALVRTPASPVAQWPDFAVSFAQVVGAVITAIRSRFATCKFILRRLETLISAKLSGLFSQDIAVVIAEKLMPWFVLHNDRPPRANWLADAPIRIRGNWSVLLA